MKDLAKELRIGNLLQGEPIQYVNQGIYSDGVFAITGYGISELELGRMFKAEPIPLTEEWLKKFCFDECMSDDGCYGFVYNHFWFMNKSQIRMNYGGYLLLDKKIEFVHQLQNLFYFLCGEELTIKEEQK